MARATKPVPLPDPTATAEPDPDPTPVVYCRECKHWGRQWPTANMAPCQLSARWLPHPALTTDLATCSQGETR